jgi:hypothetical protein
MKFTGSDIALVANSLEQLFTKYYTKKKTSKNREN